MKNKLKIMICKIGIIETFASFNFYDNDENKTDFDFKIGFIKEKSRISKQYDKYEFIEIDFKFSGGCGYYLIINDRKEYISGYSDALLLVLKTVFKHCEKALTIDELHYIEKAEFSKDFKNPFNINEPKQDK